jgi:hypothetical protein
MTAVTPRSAVFAIAVASIPLFSLAACASLEPERQWYKPGGNYTIAEFKQDQAACTKNRVLDEGCLKQRGWIPLTGDREPPARPAAPTSRGQPRY